MKALAICCCILFILPVVLAEMDYSSLNEEQFAQALQQDPAAAFSADSARAWTALETNPTLMNNPKILNEAFAQDMYRAGEVVNTYPELLDDTNVVAKFEEAAQVDIEFLNRNREATTAWLQRKYRITRDNRASFHAYNGRALTTAGSAGTTFTMSDFPNARINEDGSLTYHEATFKGNTGLSVNPGNHRVEMRGGEATTLGDAHIEATGALVYVRDCPAGPNMQQCVGAADGFEYRQAGGRPIISYRGAFTLSRENNDIRVSSRPGDQEGFTYNNQIRVIGTIIHPPQAGLDEFIIDGNTELRMFHQNERGITHEDAVMQVESSSQVYVTRSGERGEATFCRQEFSCVVDASATLDPIYRTRLAFLGMTHDDRITVTTPAYYDHVEVINSQSGLVTIQSVDQNNNNNILGTLRVGPRDEIAAQGTQLERINFGRVDVLYPENPACTGENCRQILHHWSSNGHQRAPEYFLTAHTEYLGRQRGEQNALLRCTVGVDCEESLARNFGKVIGVPPGRIATTTIIVAGDYTSTARSLEPWCQGHGGCYIINSRDVSPTTNSQNLVVTGHHLPDYLPDKNNVWREVSDVNQQSIDWLYFNPVAAGSPFDHIPTGESVESVTFSACNSALRDDTHGLDTLRTTYPHLQQVQGWTGSARSEENIDNPRLSLSEIHNLEPYTNVYPGQTEPHGQRAWYFRQDGRWVWTNDGVTCSSVGIGGGEPRNCLPITVAQR